MKTAIATVVAGRELGAEQMHAAMEQILGGGATPAQMAALLVALRIKGESAAEIAEAARCMRAHCVRVEHDELPVLVDTCGTGGDGAHTFNISTAAAIVVAAAGVPVAKHGNRAATSKAGSADVLEALGVRIELPPAQIARCIDEVGIAFMFAKAHHPAMRHVGAVRSEIGVRTLFNFLGPLCNPARATHQVIGVSDLRLLQTLAQVLGMLGGQRAWVVHGHGGLDELSLSGPSAVARLAAGVVTLGEVTPEDFGLVTQPNADLRGGDAAENARLIHAIFGGERGARRDAVVINAAAALHVATPGSSLAEAALRAAAAVDSGAAARKLQAWAAFSNAG